MRADHPLWFSAQRTLVHLNECAQNAPGKGGALGTSPPNVRPLSAKKGLKVRTPRSQSTPLVGRPNFRRFVAGGWSRTTTAQPCGYDESTPCEGGSATGNRTPADSNPQMDGFGISLCQARFFVLEVTGSAIQVFINHQSVIVIRNDADDSPWCVATAPLT